MEKLKDQLEIGMTPEQIIEILGEPDHIEEESIGVEWKWENIVDEGEHYHASVDFTNGKVTGIVVSTPDALPVELVISL